MGAGNARQSLRRCGYAGLAALLSACSAGSPDGGTQTPVCRMGALDEAQMLAVARAAPDLPLADLSHYQARKAPRAADAVLNGGGCEHNTRFRYGAGIGDITGPASGQELLGYADPAQISTGLHTRQYARAFAFASDCGGRSGRAMLVSIENALAFDSIKFGVLERIAADTEDRLGETWNIDNLLISATHTHSSASGQAHYDLANVFALGFDSQSYEAAVSGVLEAVRQAHRELQSAAPGSIGIARGEVMDGNFNRSAQAYALDPAEERAAFVDTGGREVDTNRVMTLLRLQRDDGTPVGALNWYAVHATSIGQTNELLSGDNKGYAAMRMERDFASGVFPGGEFVAGFFQSDEGDVTPNPFIHLLSEPELRARDSQAWFTRGGGRDDFESAMISGHKQYAKARTLWDDADEPLRGEVRAVHLPIDMAGVIVELPRSYAPALMPAIGAQRTCEPALGISFAGGAEDGRGPFTEGAACPMRDDQLLPFLTGYLDDTFSALFDGAIPSTLLLPVGCYNPAFGLLGYACQMEKPIAIPLSVAPLDLPVLQLQPRTIPLQIVALGNLAVVAMPWEVTTQAGRRLRSAVLDQLQDAGVDYAVIAGLSNTYIHYLTTREEYSAQNYEGASNVFGPWTLDAVLQETSRLAGHLRDGSAPQSPYAAASYTDHQPLLFFHIGVTSADARLPAGAAFGDVIEQPLPEYRMSQDQPLLVSARFHAGHPRNGLRNGGSYLYVERETADGWKVQHTDADWSTRYTYTDGEALVEWQVPPGTPAGRYRIRHEGDSAEGAYSGISQAFALAGCG